MNYKELKQIAKEVGAVIDVLMLGRHDNTVFTTGELERFAAIIEKRTIERCASVCEMLRDFRYTPTNKRHKTTAPPLFEH